VPLFSLLLLSSKVPTESPRDRIRRRFNNSARADAKTVKPATPGNTMLWSNTDADDDEGDDDDVVDEADLEEKREECLSISSLLLTATWRWSGSGIGPACSCWTKPLLLPNASLLRSVPSSSRRESLASVDATNLQSE
jgi:hypothetical protein